MTVQSHPSAFADRHIGARRQTDIDTMLKAIGYDSVDGLVDSCRARLHPPAKSRSTSTAR